jgi:hypothetical protein
MLLLNQSNIEGWSFAFALINALLIAKVIMIGLWRIRVHTWMRNSVLKMGLAVVGGLALLPSLQAQQAGHYIGGVTGLENGSGAPPGFYATYLGIVNPVDELKGPAGATIARPDITVAAQMAGYSMTVEKKILGADYGWSLLIPAVNTRFTSTAFNATDVSAGISDIYFAPVILGWTKGKANFLLDYGFYTPSGSFDPALALNPGLGYWEHQIQAGTTYSIGKPKLWNTSVLTTWEINMSKSGLDVKPGPMFTGEYSLGRRFDKYQMNAGVVGYYYKKLSADSGSGIPPIEAGILDRSFGSGGELKYTKLKWHLAFDFRYEQQYGVEAKTSGNLFVFTITYLKLFPPPAAPHK